MRNFLDLIEDQKGIFTGLQRQFAGLLPVIRNPFNARRMGLICGLIDCLPLPTLLDLKRDSRFPDLPGARYDLKKPWFAGKRAPKSIEQVLPDVYPFSHMAIVAPQSPTVNGLLSHMSKSFFMGAPSSAFRGSYFGPAFPARFKP